jgi:hypothetical protein
MNNAQSERSLRNRERFENIISELLAFIFVAAIALVAFLILFKK